MNSVGPACYLVRAFDGPGSAHIRELVRKDHRLHLRLATQDCRCILGGPLRDDAGAMIGTALVFEASGRAAVECFMAGDPYVAAGLFDRLEIDCWTIGLGAIERPVPGLQGLENGAKTR